MSEMPTLTKLQAEVLKFLRLYRDKYGYPPTRDEMRKAFGWASCNSAQQHLKLIEKKGYIRIAMGRSARGIQIL